MDVPGVPVQEMRRIEELAVKHFGVEVVQLMENAGRSVAWLAREICGTRGRTITLLCGKGRNGGDGLVAARFLSGWGARANIILPSHPDELHPLTRHLYGTATSMHLNRMTGVDSLQWELALKQSDLVVDGLLGYGIQGDPQGVYGDLIRMANQSGKKVLAVDNPSGLDCDTGAVGNPCIRAGATLTFSLPKKGLLAGTAKPVVGTLYVADTGIPHEVYELAGLKVPRLFEKKDIVKL